MPTSDRPATTVEWTTEKLRRGILSGAFPQNAPLSQDDTAARHAIRLFGEQGLTVGDNQPYSGKQLNATMDRHAEAKGIPYCTVEIRQDQIDTEAGQSRWAIMLADVMGRVALEV